MFFAQVIWYYKTYPDDRWSFKIMVLLLFTVESIHECLASASVWSYLIVRGSKDPLFLLSSNWGSVAMVIPAEICVILVDVFYILRMWKLMDKNKYALLPFIPVLVGTAHAIGFTVISWEFRYIWEFDKATYYLIMTASCKVLTDIAITVTMCALLSKRQSMIASRSKFLLKALFIWTLTTGLLTSVSTVAYLVTYLSMSKNLVYVGVYLVRTKICANAMLASLNTRKALRSITNKQIRLQAIPLSTKP